MLPDKLFSSVRCAEIYCIYCSCMHNTRGNKQTNNNKESITQPLFSHKLGKGKSHVPSPTKKLVAHRAGNTRINIRESISQSPHCTLATDTRSITFLKKSIYKKTEVPVYTYNLQFFMNMFCKTFLHLPNVQVAKLRICR